MALRKSPDPEAGMIGERIRLWDLKVATAGKSGGERRVEAEASMRVGRGFGVGPANSRGRQPVSRGKTQNETFFGIARGFRKEE